MKDRFFYPLAALVIFGMIAFALSLKTVTTPSNVDIYERQGVDLADLFPSPGTTVRLSESGDDIYAVLSAHMTREIAPPSSGVFGTLGPAYEANFGGADIVITVRARQSKTTPSTKMELGYFTTGVGDSGWKPFVLSNEFVDYSFEFSPNPPLDEGIDYVGIWPDPEGKGGMIDVQSVKVERLRP